MVLYPSVLVRRREFSDRDAVRDTGEGLPLIHEVRFCPEDIFLHIIGCNPEPELPPRISHGTCVLQDILHGPAHPEIIKRGCLGKRMPPFLADKAERDIVGIAFHKAVSYGGFPLCLRLVRIHIDYAQGTAQAERIGELAPFVYISFEKEVRILIADILSGQILRKN